MNKIKVLVLDEEVLTRQTVASVLRREPNLEIRVSGETNEVLEVIEELKPNIVILNIEDGEKEHYAGFDSLREHYPELPVIVLTSRTESGARHALYALRNGAVDFITKPGEHKNLLFANRHLIKRLWPAIFSAKKLINREETKQEIAEFLKGVQRNMGKELITNFSQYRVIVIGASIGGPEALFSLFRDLPDAPSVPVVIVQHLPKYYTKELARYLDRFSKAEVEEAYDGAELKPGTVWIAPGGFQCELCNKGTGMVLKLHRGPRENGVRPSISVLFRSAGKVFGSGVLGIILSGHGSDGLAGARSIRGYGGTVVVQDPNMASVPSLPLSVIDAGLTEYYFPIQQLIDLITTQVKKNVDVQDR